MSDKDEDPSLNAEVILPLSIPADSKIPDPLTGVSSPDEYDLYFRILRNNPGLLEWSRTCLDIYDLQLKDLDQTSLTVEEKVQILEGILLIQRFTLEKWVKTGETIKGYK